jgi:hypothetical protein
MTQAERIRQFALDHYVAPARAEGYGMITIRAGDVHQLNRDTNARNQCVSRRARKNGLSVGNRLA